jgi:sugar lactone lactonase YvrE
MAVVFVAVAFPQKGVAPASGVLGAIQPTVVAQGVAARALAIGPQASIYVTVASPADRIFTLLDSATTALPQNSATALAPVAGTGLAGSLGDGGAALSAQLSLNASLAYERSGVSFAPDGTTYIADTENGTIRRIAGSASTEPGIIRSVAGQWAPRQNLTLSRPMGIALDRAGNLYIADHSAGVLDILHQDTGLLETLAQVSSPASVAVTSDGSEAFVASPETGAVFAINLHTRSIHSVEGIGGQSTSAGEVAEVSPCSAGSNRVCPSGLAVDGAGNLFVSDLTFGRVVRVDARTGATSVALSNLQQPGALAFDPQGRNLYIAEQGLNRIIVAQGAGDPPGALSISPSSWAFANEPISGVSQQEQFTVTNTSSAAVSGIAVAFQPTAPATTKDFSVESTSCLSTLAAAASCAVNVAFTPTSMGPLASAVAVTDTNGDSSTASVTGTGDDYQLQLASGQTQEVSVIEGSSATFHFQVAPLGVFGQSGEQVAIVCPSETPLRSTCTVNPATVTVTTGSPSPFTITIQTSSTATLAKFIPSFFSNPFNSRDRLLLIGVVFGIIGIGALSITFSQFRYVRVPVLLMAGVLLLAGCHHASSTSLATPTGTAQILVQGAALSKTGASLNATRGVTVVLDVLKN